MIRAEEITGVILCGGSGVRMGGVDKPLQMLAGMPMVQHVRQRLAPQVSRILVSANQHHVEYGAWGDTVVVDETPNQGPLGGIASALAYTDSLYVFCCPGDAPRLSRTLVATLAHALTLSSQDVAIPHDGEQSQHLFMLVAVRVLPQLQDYLCTNRRSVAHWVATTQHTVVDASHEHDSFVNINTAVELRAVESVLP